MAPSSRDVLQYKDLLSLDLSGRYPYDILVSGRAAAREDHSPTRQHRSLWSPAVLLGDATGSMPGRAFCGATVRDHTRQDLPCSLRLVCLLTFTLSSCQHNLPPGRCHSPVPTDIMHIALLTMQKESLSTCILKPLSWPPSPSQGCCCVPDAGNLQGTQEVKDVAM